jgi:hypothetical protein
MDLSDAYVVDFSGPAEIGHPDWIIEDLTVADIQNDIPGWNQEAIDDGHITMNEDMSLLMKEPSIVGDINELIGDYHEWNSKYGMSIIPATYEVTAIAGGDFGPAYSAASNMTILSDSGTIFGTMYIPRVARGTLSFIQMQASIYDGSIWFDFEKKEPGMGIITGIILTCVPSPELPNGLDDDCNNLVDDIPPSYLRNTRDFEVDVNVIIGVEKNVSGSWQEYEIVYNTSENLQSMLPFRESSYSGPLQPTNINGFTIDLNHTYALQNQFAHFGGFSTSETGTYRIFLEVQDENGSRLANSALYDARTSQYRSRMYSNEFYINSP